MRGDSYQLQGQGGGIVLTAADTGTGTFRWIQVINDAVLNECLSNLTDGSTKLVTITLPAGLGIGGVFTSIKVTSGTVIAYYG